MFSLYYYHLLPILKMESMKLLLMESNIRMVTPLTEKTVAIVGETKGKSTVYLFTEGKLKKSFSVEGSLSNFGEGFYFLNANTQMIDLYSVEGDLLRSIDFLRENDQKDFVFWVCYFGKRIVYLSADNKLISFENGKYTILGSDVMRVMHVDDEVEFFTYQSSITSGVPESVIVLRYNGNVIENRSGVVTSPYVYNEDGFVVYSIGGDVITYDVNRRVKSTYSFGGVPSDGTLISFNNGVAYLQVEDKIRNLSLLSNSYFEVNFGKALFGKKVVITDDYIITFRKESFSNLVDKCRPSEIVFYFDPSRLFIVKSEIEECTPQTGASSATPVRVVIEK